MLSYSEAGSIALPATPTCGAIGGVPLSGAPQAGVVWVHAVGSSSATKPIAYQVAGKCWVNNHAHVLRPNRAIGGGFLCASLMHYPVEPWLSGSTGRAKLTQGALLRLPIAIPPESELPVLAERISATFAHAERLPSMLVGLTRPCKRSIRHFYQKPSAVSSSNKTRTTNPQA